MNKCLRCGFQDQYKGNVKRHLNRKKLCEPKLSNLSREECLNFLKTGDCKMGMELLIRELENVKQSMIVMNNSGDNCTNINGTNNTINNINIIVNPYNKTDYSVLKDKIHTCIKNGKVDEAKLIKLLHFNENHPENHNVLIENKREKTIKVYNGKDFEESEYSGRQGIWDFSQNTLKKTGEQEFVGDFGEKTFDAIEKTKDENKNLDKTTKCKKTNAIQKELFNGTKNQKQFKN